MKNNVKIIITGIISVFLLIGCSRQDTNQNNNPVKVEVETLKISDAGQEFLYSGTIGESETIPLCFSGMGTVARVYVNEGDYVKKGQLLASLDNTTSQSTYAIMLAQEQQAEDAYKRLTPMYKNGNLSEVKYIEVETGLQKAKASAAIAKKNLDDCNLYSTADGYIGTRSINPGMTAMPNLTSITVVKINKVFACVSVAENEISQIRKGQKASVTIGALEAKVYDGTVEEVGVMADPIAHSYKIKIGIVNGGMLIKPGMICTASILGQNKKQSLTAPGRAVLIDEAGKNFVYVISPQNRAVRKYVVTGQLLNEGIQILSGLQINDKVVVAGQLKLVDNIPVQIVNQ